MDALGLSWRKQDLKIKTSIGDLRIRLIKNGDEDLFLKFSTMIGDKSKTLFSPYHWGTDKQISEYSSAIAKTESGDDASFIVLDSYSVPVALLNLWGISRKHLFNNQLMHIPTLGICVADQYQNKGVGKTCMKFLQDAARTLQADAIELTTVKHNKHAVGMYLSCGFKDIGMLNIPLGVDPSTTNESELINAKWRKERHMVYIVKQATASNIMKFLLQKQTQYNDR